MQHHAQALGVVDGRKAWHGVVRLFVLLGLLPVLFLGSSPSAQALLHCRVTQVVHTSCCCPSGDMPSAPAMSPSCCCDRVQIDATVPAGSLQSEAHHALANLGPVARLGLSFGAYALSATPRPDPKGRLTEQTRARAGPSLIVLHRRFLI